MAAAASSFWQKQPTPKNGLGYHRLLSPTAGVRVSPLCLGALNFGEAWKDFVGECSKETSFEMLDYFYENGGNFIDTANSYQNEESEKLLGEWMEKKGNRDEMVLATKYSNTFPKEQLGGKIVANYQGNHRKSLHLSLKNSLRKLRTDYIDLLYVHWWDFTTSVPELMQSLHHLVESGKVLYLGISDTPAWIVSKANEYARCHGMTQFSVYQGHWSAAKRDLERDILPMCEAEGMAIAPWGALGQGAFKPQAEYEARTDGRWMGRTQTDEHLKVTAALEKIAKEKNTLITSIALAYVMHKAPYVFPIVGGRKLEHLKSNVEALAVELSDEEIAEIDAAVPFDGGFPNTMLFEFGANQKYRYGLGPEDVTIMKPTLHLKHPKKVQPIKPSQWRPDAA